MGGSGGHGGGAIQLFSSSTIHVTTAGIVSASGQIGGSGFLSMGHAGGGGSGGTVMLEALRVIVDGVATTTGGTGGSVSGGEGGQGGSDPVDGGEGLCYVVGMDEWGGGGGGGVGRVFARTESRGVEGDGLFIPDLPDCLNHLLMYE